MSAVMKHGNMGHFVPHGAIRLSQAAAAGSLMPHVIVAPSLTNQYQKVGIRCKDHIKVGI